MKLQLQMYQCGSPLVPGDGLRIGVVRRKPWWSFKKTFVRENYYDEWWPVLAPSEDLLKWYNEHVKATGDRLAFEHFRRQYQREMKSPEAREAIQRLVDLARRQPVAIGCYCEDETLCHRSVLFKLIQKAAAQG